MDGMYDHYCLVTWEFLPGQCSIISTKFPLTTNVVQYSPSRYFLLIGENTAGHVTPRDRLDLDVHCN